MGTKSIVGGSVLYAGGTKINELDRKGIPKDAPNEDPDSPRQVPQVTTSELLKYGQD